MPGMEVEHACQGVDSSDGQPASLWRQFLQPPQERCGVNPQNTSGVGFVIPGRRENALNVIVLVFAQAYKSISIRRRSKARLSLTTRLRRAF